MSAFPSTVMALYQVRTALVEAKEAAVEVRQFDELVDRLETLDGATLLAFEALGQPLGPLFQTVTEAARAHALSRELRHDLRLALEVLETSLEHLVAPPGLAPLGLEQLKLAYTHVDLSQRLNLLLGHFVELAAKREVRVEVETPPSLWVEVDLPKVETVVLNLLFNAFKHTPIGGQVTVHLRSAPGSDDAVLTVLDSGPAVPRSVSTAIFERSRQLERNIFFAGPRLGFNLGVSRAYCRLHGGSLALYYGNSPSCAFRARFSMRAPLGVVVAPPTSTVSGFAAEVAATAARELDEEAHLGERPCDERKPRVLIVDRSRPLHRVLRQCLAEDFCVASAFDGASGLVEATALLPDLIIVDTELEGLTGVELIRELRAQRQAELKEVPILLFAGHDDEGAVSALQHGAQDLLRKPILLQEVRARVDGLVAAKRARDVMNEALGRHEADLVRLAREMAAQQRRLHSAFEEVRVARELAEAASRVKSNFLRMISHELRTPVAAIRLYVQALQRDRRLELPSAAQEGLRRVSRVNLRLSRLIDTMVEWARVESNRCRVEVKSFDVAALVDEVFEELESYAGEKGVELRKAGPRPLQLSSDPRLMRLITNDLVSFALQNTQRGVIEVAYEARSQGLRLSVIDGAAHLASEQVRETFSPLQVSEDLTWRSGHGSGLGLYVVRDLARAVGGELGVDSSHPGPGNRFVLDLPALEAEAPVQADRLSRRRARRRLDVGGAAPR
jgi:signal transduction histidine kinase